MATLTADKHVTATLIAATVDDVTFNYDITSCEIVHHGNASQPIYFRRDGVNPVSAAAENEVVLAGERLLVTLPRSNEIRFISAGVPTYTVTRHE